MELKAEYQKWIDSNVEGTGYGACREVTEKMLEAFPHLKRVKGLYHCVFIGERTHWWLVDTDGSVVDPTRMQFPSKGACTYEELSEEEIKYRVPIGKCMECGSMIFQPRDGSYQDSTICSEECGNAYAAAMM